MAARVYALIALVVILVATLYPLKFGKKRDSFPLSDYPMFARARANASVRLFYFVATTPDRERKYVAPDMVGNVEVLQARALIFGAVRRGPVATTKLCNEVAGRLADEPGYAGASLSIVEGRHDALKFFIEKQLGSERVLTRCQISGDGG